MKNKIYISIVMTFFLFLAACNQEKVVEEKKITSEEESYVVAVANEKDSTLSIIHYPEKKQEIIELEGQAHNVEINKKTSLIWVTINPGHDDGGHHGHGDENAGPKAVAYDINTLKKVEEYPIGNHPAHITSTEDGMTIYAANAEDNTVSMINRKTGEIDTIHVGSFPHGLRVSPDQKFVYVANNNSTTVSIIDIQKKHQVKQIEVGNTPVQTGFSHNGKYGFVSLHKDNELGVIDHKTQQVLKKVKTANGPLQMFATYDNKYVVMALQGTEENPNNVVSIISQKDFKTVKNIEVGNGAHGVVVSNDSKFAFITNMYGDTMSVIDLKTLEEIDRIKVGKYPNGISVN